jgi:hypothetical protein
MEDKQYELERFKLITEQRKWSHISKTIATLGIWAGVAVVCCVLGGTTEPPMLAGSICTSLIWIISRWD